MKRILTFTVIAVLVSACASLHVEKRRFNKGVHISFGSRLKSKHEEKADKTFSSESSVDRIKASVSKSFYTESQDTIQLERGNRLALETYVSDDKHTEKPNASRQRNYRNKAKSIKPKTQQNSVVNAKRSSNREQKNDRSRGLMYFLSLGILPIIFAGRKKGLQMAKWASWNKTKAQIAIVGLVGVSATTSYLLGNMFQFSVDSWMLFLPAGLFASSFALVKVNKDHKEKFSRDRIAFSLFNVGTYFGTFAMGASNSRLFDVIADPGRGGEMDSSVAVVLTILLTLVFLAAVFGLSILACNIACNGFGAAAIAVLVGGTYLIGFLCLWAIFGMFNGSTNKKHNIQSAALWAILPIAILGVLFLLTFLL